MGEGVKFLIGWSRNASGDLSKELKEVRREACIYEDGEVPSKEKCMCKGPGAGNIRRVGKTVRGVVGAE